MDYGVDRYKRPVKPTREREESMQAEREAYVQQQANELWKTVPKSKKAKK